MIRDSEQLLNDLINLNADAWNTKLAKELGVTVEVLRSITSKKDSITLSEDMIHLSVKNEDIKKTVKQISSGSNPINKYVIRYINNGETDKFIGMSCTGKVIIGIDFSESDMSNSYFCDCTFFNCSFSNTSLDSSVFNAVCFNNCALSNASLTCTTIIKSFFIDCSLPNTDFNSSAIIETMLLDCDMVNTDLSVVRLIGTGLINCNIKDASFKASELTTTSIVNTTINDSVFDNTGWFDSIVTSISLLGCSFFNAYGTCVSATLIHRASKSAYDFFKMSANSLAETEMLLGDDDGGDHAETSY